MIKETKILQTSAGEYLAPKVKVVELKPRRVMCGSYTETGSDNADDEYL